MLWLESQRFFFSKFAETRHLYRKSICPRSNKGFIVGVNISDFEVISTCGCRNHERKDRFPFNNTATVITSFYLASFR